MKLNIRSLILASIACSSITPYAVAEVTLEVPSDVTVFSANEKKPKLEGGLFSSTKTITLPDGDNQLVFKYEASFDQGDERKFATSDAIIAKFNATDTTLSFELPEYRNLRTAEKEIANLQWQLVDDQQQAIEVKQDKLLKDGMQIGRDYVREAQDYNRVGGVAALATTALTTTSTQQATSQTTPATQTKAQATQTGSTAEEMLHFWYEKADSETKQRFKDYINQK
ncbi:DUF2057 family protein [Vibrio maerlii]|uniref:DUF2057 family protein n=1 Tax=Vibrio maerlii TaxID=2231648 RepID=UPI000E3EB0B5|nr:DUF2057 family protein [Vibrio maerlii]